MEHPNALMAVLYELTTMDPHIIAGERVSTATREEDLNAKQKAELVKYCVNQIREVGKAWK